MRSVVARELLPGAIDAAVVAEAGGVADLAKHDGQIVSRSCSWIVKSDPQ
jgi:hypothetical protein